MDHGWTADGRPLIRLQTQPAPVLPRAHAELVGCRTADGGAVYNLPLSPLPPSLPLPDETTHHPATTTALASSSPTLPTASAAAASCVSSSNASFLPSPFRVPIALPPKIERRRRRNSQLIAERAAGRVHQAHCTWKYRRAAARARPDASPSLAHASCRRFRRSPSAEIHLLIWLMSERECGMNLDDAGFPRGIQSIHHSAIRSIHLSWEGFRRWLPNWPCAAAMFRS